MDAYCGKFSMTDVFTQYGMPFPVLKPLRAVRKEAFTTYLGYEVTQIQ